MYLIFDTETTGLPKNYRAPVTDTDNWPRCVQLAWQLHDERGKLIDAQNHIIKPDGFTIPYNSEKIHGISTERALKEGKPLEEVVALFSQALEKTTIVVGHNVEFDINIMGAEYVRAQANEKLLLQKKSIDTKNVSTNFCAIPGGKGGRFKWPTLTELHKKLFGKPFDDAHDAAYDVDATARCFFGLIEHRVVKPIEGIQVSEVNYEAPKLEAANFAAQKDEAEDQAEKVMQAAQKVDIGKLKDVSFSHLHCHTQYSVLQATSEISAMIDKALEDGMPAITMTDSGNMMGAFNFVQTALSRKDEDGNPLIKPVVGSEFNLCKDRTDTSNKDNGHQTVLLAKNKAGYHNLAKLSSYSFTEGFYYVPRIDKELLMEYKENLIATTGGPWGEIPDLILNVGEEQAEKAFLWWKEQFGDDFYVELNRHGIPEEERLNEVLLRFAKKYDVKYFAANNTFYNDKKDAYAHDILLCVKDGELVSKPKKYIGSKGREFRFGFPNDEFYIKTQDEMKRLFADLPEAIETTNEIVSKIEAYELKRDVLLPKYDIPEEFVDPKDAEDGGNRGENAYLRHLAFEGAKKRYGEITPEIEERLNFELQTIENTGYPGYFLIVQDFTTKAREMGVSVGPGRGSAAGSAVAYCIGITNIDPIEYDLLFERFLNPDRVSLPDIDIDFDDEGRQKVIDYVIDKYGENQVAQIMTYGTMAAKSAIRDTARVLDIPLNEADRLAKLIPDMSKLKKIFSWSDEQMKEKLKGNSEDINNAKQLIEISKRNDEYAETINQARVIEGSVRNTGIHACGVIITPDDITNYVPIARAKDTGMYCTQFDNAVVENAGMLKMDFLGLKTLTLIKHTVEMVKERHNVELDMETVSLEDDETFELFQRGDTVGIFQYESAGMQKYLRELKPTAFADLIAMNALYRPGPLEYIPSFIKRKHGDEEIIYDLPDMQEYLEETYGITVYQEQVMLLSQKLAGFTKGEADVLRKAMGKKIISMLNELKPKFISQGEERGHPKKVLEKIWKDWEAFASYAFNKSHSTCYAWIAYQTAYLKAHYPAEYMAAVLTNNLNDISKVTFFMEECKRMQTPVLGPDINESAYNFTVNDKGEIRFGLGAIKGVGGKAVESIVRERKENGPYVSVFDFTSRVDLKSVNKKCLENLVLAGAMDCFEDYHRSQYLHEEGGRTFLEQVLKYGASVKREQASSQQSLFGGDDGEVDMPVPKAPECPKWGALEKLSKEKEVVGIYISGHPLDDYRFEIDNFCNAEWAKVTTNLQTYANKELCLCGIVTSFAERETKKGKPFGILEIEDYSGSIKHFMFDEEYTNAKPNLSVGYRLFVQGKVQKKRWGDDLEFRMSKVIHLCDVMKEKAKELKLKVPLSNLNEDLVLRLQDILMSNGQEGESNQPEEENGVQEEKVKLKYRFIVLDYVEKLKLEMPAMGGKVEFSPELVKGLEELKSSGVEYQLG